MAGEGTQSHAEADGSTSDAADDFEFCNLSSGALAPTGAGAETVDMCVADELFSNGKLLPLRKSSAAASDAPTPVLLPRSESAASTVGFGSRSDSRSASSSGSSSGCVSRSQSSKSAASDHGPAAPAPRRRSLSSSLFYAHPSPSPQLRWAQPRRSTGSAPAPSAWGFLRLGVAGAPEVYPPRPAETKNAAVARGGASKSARFEQPSAAVDKKFSLGLFRDSFGCKCSPDSIEPVRLPAKKRKQSRKKDGVKSGVRRSRIVHWLEELSITKEKKCCCCNDRDSLI
jgi:hypothetical protein